MVLLASCVTTPSPLPPSPVHSNGQTLWHIVHDQCLPDQLDHGNPAPCAQVSIANGPEHGYAVLKDLRGVSQYLVLPTILITGIEDARLLSPGAANYFSAAWQARHLVEQRLGKTLAREDVGIAVNSIYGRSQDLLHLHVDCLRADVRDELRRQLVSIGYQWSARSIALAGHGYHAIRIDGDEVVKSNPFIVLATKLHVTLGDMRAWTLVLAGERFQDGLPGFVLLAARADPAAAYRASGEVLLDHGCAARGER
jgi:CDP-diacylglycerol pyrophosphatase